MAAAVDRQAAPHGHGPVAGPAWRRPRAVAQNRTAELWSCVALADPLAPRRPAPAVSAAVLRARHLAEAPHAAAPARLAALPPPQRAAAAWGRAHQLAFQLADAEAQLFRVACAVPVPPARPAAPSAAPRPDDDDDPFAALSAAMAAHAAAGDGVAQPPPPTPSPAAVAAAAETLAALAARLKTLLPLLTQLGPLLLSAAVAASAAAAADPAARHGHHRGPSDATLREIVASVVTGLQRHAGACSQRHARLVGATLALRAATAATAAGADPAAPASIPSWPAPVAGPPALAGGPLPSTAPAVAPASDVPLYTPSMAPGGHAGLRTRTRHPGVGETLPLPQGPAAGDGGGDADGGGGGATASTVIDFAAGTSYAQEQQMLLLESEAQGAQTAYSRQRAGGVDALETAVAELGQLYTHFTQLLAGQRDVVMRIDQDVFVAEANTRQAHSELLKYYTFVGSRRRGMLQVFVALLLVFFLMRLLL